MEISYTENVKRLCKERGIQVNQIAKYLDVTRESASRLINQETPSLKTVEKLAEIFGVSVKEILFGPDPQPPAPAHYCPHCGKVIRISIQAVTTAAEQQPQPPDPGTADQNQDHQPQQTEHNTIPSLWE